MSGNIEHQTPPPQQPGLCNLNHLPLELLHRIITVGPCENALALCRVSKRLHAICRSPFIYLEIIENKLKHDLIIPGKSKTPWHITAGLDKENDPSICAKWALADSRARAASADNNVALKNQTVELLEWEPHLLVMNHPEARAMCVRARADPTAQVVTEPGQVLGLSFMFAYSTMILDVDCPGRTSNLSRPESEIRKILEACWARFGSLLPVHAATFLLEPFPRHLDAWEIHATANMALGWFSQHLNHALRVRRIHRITSWAQQLPPPCLSKIPLTDLMALGPPFSSKSSFYPRSSLCDKAALRSFLGDGEWVGYYTYSFQGPGTPVFDSMMSGIHFRSPVMSNENPTSLHLTSRGVDGCGSFGLQGLVSVANGRVTLMKVYDAGVSWAWDGVITSFGCIGGTWGSNQWGGWLFLWKRDWSP